MIKLPFTWKSRREGWGRRRKPPVDRLRGNFPQRLLARRHAVEAEPNAQDEFPRQKGLYKRPLMVVIKAQSSIKII